MTPGDRAEQVIERVRSEFPSVWMGMRQRDVLKHAIEQALIAHADQEWEARAGDKP